MRRFFALLALLVAFNVAAQPSGPPLTAENIGRRLYDRTAAEVTAGVTPVRYRYPYCNLLRYYSGSGSITTAFNNAIAACAAGNNATLIIPNGVYTFSTAPSTIGYGIMIEAPGSQGTNECCGTVLIFDYNTSNGLEWDGNGADFKGTGGGLKNVTLQVQNGRTLGDLIKLTAVSDARRPGEMVFENVVGYGIGTGLMTRGLHIDGSAATDGVRSVHLEKFRVADCTQNLAYIYINEGVHVTGDHVQVDQGDGTGTVGMTITGASQNVELVNSVINGELEVNATATHVNVQGRASTVDVNDTATTGSFIGSSSTITDAAPDFRIVSNAAGAFLAAASADILNQTGDGTAYTVVFDSEKYDRAAEYNPGTGIFTATQAGVREFDATVVVLNLTAAATLQNLAIVRKNSGAVEQERTTTIVNATITPAGNGYWPLHSHAQFFMNEGDTVEVVLAISNTTKTIDIEGSGLTTQFSGRLW